MTLEHKERIETALGALNTALREQTIDTQLVTIEQWNAEIAPKLSALSMAIEGISVTARTYKLPKSYFDS